MKYIIKIFNISLHSSERLKACIDMEYIFHGYFFFAMYSLQEDERESYTQKYLAHLIRNKIARS